MSIITMNFLYDLVGVAIATVVVAITFLKWRFSYWRRRGLPTLNPQIPFGDGKALMSKTISFSEFSKDIYNQLKAKGVRHGGIFIGTIPYYVPVDPELIKHIMQNDFKHFVNHGFYFDKDADPLSAHLFNLEDEEWKNMRAKLTPMFTSTKLKIMFQTLADCAVNLRPIMDESAASNVPVDMKEIFGRFTTDVIGSCAFGLECNCLKDPNAVFREFSKKIFEDTFVDGMKSFALLSLPQRLLRMIKLKITKFDVERFFMDVVRQTVEYREKNYVYRKDFLHFLLQLKNRGIIKDDGKIINKAETTRNALTMNELAAQAYLFFIAGYETSSTTMTFALYEIATNEEIQDKLRAEIDEVLAKHQGQLTYDAIMEMTYMDKVLNETLRKYPAMPMIPRKCNKDYVVPNTDILIEKGTDVAILTIGVHMDPEYYPNPEKFDPERFSTENKNSTPAFTWFPFGEGPRICIGLRFAMMQNKVCFAELLKNFRITLNKKTKLPPKLDKMTFVTTFDGGVWVNFEKIK